GAWIFTTPPPFFRLLGLRRTPVVTIVIVWSLLASYLPGGQDIHQLHLDRSVARQVQPGDERVGGAPAVRTGVGLQAAFDEWVERRCLGPRTSATATPAGGTTTMDAPTVVPLILVATSGGGIRAATWTTYVMDDLLGYDAGLPTPPCARSQD